MNRHFILKRDHSQVAILKLGDLSPKTVAVPFLSFRADRRVKYSNAPFLLQIGTLAQNLLLEIFREPVLWHLPEDNPFPFR